MYSWEIDKILRDNNYYISSKIYLELFNVQNNQQIKIVKYNPFENTYYIETYDNYNWIIRIY